MKKAPMRRYEKESGNATITGEMTVESRRRKSSYLRNGGCNAYHLKSPKSAPLSFWTEQDVLQYLLQFNVPYCKVYGDIVQTGEGLKTTDCKRTGCMFCMFGVHMEGAENRFMRMQRTHPELWKYCIYTLGLKQVLDYIGVPYASMFTEGVA